MGACGAKRMEYVLRRQVQLRCRSDMPTCLRNSLLLLAYVPLATPRVPFQGTREDFRLGIAVRKVSRCREVDMGNASNSEPRED